MKQPAGSRRPAGSPAGFRLPAASQETSSVIPGPEAMTSIAVSSCCVAATVIDLRTRRVPNALTWPAAVAGIVFAVTGAGRVGIAASIAGGVIGLALMLPGYLFGGTGGGDVKL